MRRLILLQQGHREPTAGTAARCAARARCTPTARRAARTVGAAARPWPLRRRSSPVTSCWQPWRYRRHADALHAGIRTRWLVQAHDLLEVEVHMAWSLAAQEGRDVPLITVHRELPHTAAGVLWVLVVVPEVKPGHLVRLVTEVYPDHVSLRLYRSASSAVVLEEWRHPHVAVIACATHSVQELVQRARILIDALKVIQVPRRRVDLVGVKVNGLKRLIEHLQRREADVVQVAPRGVDHDRDAAADAPTHVLPLGVGPRDGPTVHANTRARRALRLQTSRGRPPSGGASGTLAEQL
mmetsp:Transcript_39489/g.102207  ORF Transcript_39489/g.102207 Transcript_39489/m.102207 type:complete len:296 (+) Transcript_39489:68-955(+)